MKLMKTCSNNVDKAACQQLIWHQTTTIIKRATFQAASAANLIYCSPECAVFVTCYCQPAMLNLQSSNETLNKCTKPNTVSLHLLTIVRTQEIKDENERNYSTTQLCIHRLVKRTEW